MIQRQEIVVYEMEQIDTEKATDYIHTTKDMPEHN